MKNNLTSLFVTAFLVVSGFGCRSCETIDSSKLAPSEVYQEYVIAASDEATTVTATFRVSGPTGTTIALVPPAKVEYNERNMEGHERTLLSGSYYTASVDGLVGQGAIVYTDAGGKVYRNPLTIERISIVDAPANFSTSAPLKIKLSRPVGSGENVTLSLISNTPRPKPTPASTPIGNSGSTQIDDVPAYEAELHGTYDSDDSSFTVDTSAFRNFVPGTASLNVSLRGSQKLAQATPIGGTMVYEYRSPSVNVSVRK